MFVELHTDRLSFHPLDVYDASFMLRLLNTESWLRFIGDKQVQDLADAAGYILWIQQNKAFYYHVIRLKDSFEPIGVVTLLHRNGQPAPDLGFALLPDYEGQGYAFEACAAYLQKLQEDKALKIILAIAMPSNEKSLKLLGRLGFSFEKEMEEAGEELLVYRKEW